MRKCTVCNHPQRAAIDRALVAGEPLRPLALRNGVSHFALFRHKRDHIPADLVRAVQHLDLARAGRLVEQVERQEIEVRARALDVMDELERAFARVNKVFDACDRWLTDPDHPERYDLGPRAEEVIVHYSQPGPDGERVTRKARLSTLLARLDGTGKAGQSVEVVELRGADPRELMLKTARRLEAELQLVARLVGQLREQETTVNVLVASPEWIELRTAILNALAPFPDARRAVAEAIRGAGGGAGGRGVRGSDGGESERMGEWEDGRMP